MLPDRLIKGLDRRRLRWFLAMFFLALAAPTAALIWQAYGQLKWEAFHQYRGDAEELTHRIDAGLADMIRSADARSFADYSFLVLSGDPAANFVQRSDLSTFPVADDLPGVLGYFQVDASGTFSTPLLPPDSRNVESLGISQDEYADRLQVATTIRNILADNRLVPSRPAVGERRAFDAADAGPGAESEFEPGPAVADDEGAVASRQVASSSFVADNDYSQLAFDRLNQAKDIPVPSSNSRDEVGFRDLAELPSKPLENFQRTGKVSDLKLDGALEKKSEEVEKRAAKEKIAPGRLDDNASRTTRSEQIALPASLAPTEYDFIGNFGGLASLPITTFESEIDPFEFRLLDSGHVVFFRNVWRDGNRYVQGILVDSQQFLSQTVGNQFRDTSLANMSNLIVAFQDDVIRTFDGRLNSQYPDVAEELGSSLLYRNQLSAPLQNLELIYSIQRLPPGAGGTLLGWVSLVLAVVLAGGFLTLYQLGTSQINLARQQQDFVSAVSHELKTPLTSIRMYGEMLREGWVDDEKRQTYYEFIHDESERLSRLISNVLQLASITRNDRQFDCKPVLVSELMSNVESKIAGQVARAGFKLEFSRDESADEATIHIDEDCFAQVVINLVDNAIKFSRNAENKTVVVGCKRAAGNRIVFSVRDFGPGIPKQQMKKIFQLFYRSESELTRETVGTGIGLAIVQELTSAMAGSVDLVNVSPGAEFRLSFPCSPDP